MHFPVLPPRHLAMPETIDDGFDAVVLDHGWIKAGGLMTLLATVLTLFGGQSMGTLLVSPDKNPSITFNLFQQMVLCQLTHGLAMIASGILITLRPRRMLIVSQWCFLSGTTIHSVGAIANLLWGNPLFSMASITGGVVILLGWLAFVEGACPGCQRTRKANPSCQT